MGTLHIFRTLVTCSILYMKGNFNQKVGPPPPDRVIPQIPPPTGLASCLYPPAPRTGSLILYPHPQVKKKVASYPPLRKISGTALTQYWCCPKDNIQLGGLFGCGFHFGMVLSFGYGFPLNEEFLFCYGSILVRVCTMLPWLSSLSVQISPFLLNIYFRNMVLVVFLFKGLIPVWGA